MISDYRLDGYGRPVHKDLDALAVEITKYMAANHGRAPETYPIPLARFQHLQQENAYFNGGSKEYGGSIAAPIDRTNFIWRGVPVVPAEA